MPLFALVFGSFGDFVTALQLVKNVSQAVLDSSGASLEYQQLASEIVALQETLCLAHEAARKGFPGTPLGVGAAAAVTREVVACASILRACEQKINHYQGLLRRNGSEGMMRESWRKIGWSLFKDAELRRAREQLAQCRSRLGALLDVQQLSHLITGGEVLADVHRRQTEQNVLLDQVVSYLQQLPPALGYPWERGASLQDTPIKATDWFGRTLLFPPILYKTAEDFTCVFGISIKDFPRSALIFPHGLDTLKGSKGDVVSITDWDAQVKPGSTIDMTTIEQNWSTMRHCLTDSISSYTFGKTTPLILARTPSETACFDRIRLRRLGTVEDSSYQQETARQGLWTPRAQAASRTNWRTSSHWRDDPIRITHIHLLPTQNAMTKKPSPPPDDRQAFRIMYADMGRRTTVFFGVCTLSVKV